MKVHHIYVKYLSKMKLITLLIFIGWKFNDIYYAKWEKMKMGEDLHRMFGALLLRIKY